VTKVSLLDLRLIAFLTQGIKLLLFLGPCLNFNEFFGPFLIKLSQNIDSFEEIETLVIFSLSLLLLANDFIESHIFSLDLLGASLLCHTLNALCLDLLKVIFKLILLLLLEIFNDCLNRRPIAEPSVAFSIEVECLCFCGWHSGGSELLKNRDEWL
jgi:hypothetical protein